MFNKIALSTLAMLAAMSLTGCENSWYPFLYKPTFTQGNNINPNAVAVLKPGMTKSQVLSVMGNPVLDTPLSADTWYYIYTLNEKGKVTQHKKVILYFAGDHLSKIAEN